MANGYRLIDFDASTWKSEERMHDALESGLSFPDYYGENLDALDECMCEDVVVPDEGGLVLVFHHYDQFAKAVRIDKANARSLAELVLHVLARAVRHHILFGRGLMILVQSNDPQIRFDSLCPIAAGWNPREWLLKNRGL